MGKCCSTHMVPTAIMAECYIATCTVCGDENFVFYDDERVQQWKDDGKNPVDVVTDWCRQRYPEARPRIKR